MTVAAPAMAPEGARPTMPVSEFIAEKWDRRLYNWLLWMSSDDTNASRWAKISSAYRGQQFGAGYREAGTAVLSGEAMDTDALMVVVQRRNPSIYDALVAWTLNDGTRGAQAARLGVHRDTLRDRVDSGLSMLERMDTERRYSKCPAPTPQKA